MDGKPKSQSIQVDIQNTDKAGEWEGRWIPKKFFQNGWKTKITIHPQQNQRRKKNVFGLDYPFKPKI